jgi:hypothetical protein
VGGSGRQQDESIGYQAEAVDVRGSVRALGAAMRQQALHTLYRTSTRHSRFSGFVWPSPAHNSQHLFVVDVVVLLGVV